ncbi:hypothetical protein ACIQKE_31360 [Streptomyces griseoviridis]
MPGPVPPDQPPPASWHRPEHPLSLWRWRGNPLCRRTDRIQGWIALGLLVLVPCLAAATATTARDTVSDHYRAVAEHQARSRYFTPAVLVHDAPRHPEPASPEARHTRYPVTVRYTDPLGHERTARTEVEPGLSGGSTTGLWVDADGSPARPPMPAAEIRSRALGWALLAFAAVTVAGIAVYDGCCRILLRRNSAEWDEAWARTGPRWSRFP